VYFHDCARQSPDAIRNKDRFCAHQQMRPAIYCPQGTSWPHLSATVGTAHDRRQIGESRNEIGGMMTTLGYFSARFVDARKIASLNIGSCGAIVRHMQPTVDPLSIVALSPCAPPFLT
jgi:hypothetical protein